MKKHSKTMAAALAALGLVAAALGMSSPAMAGTSGKCSSGSGYNVCMTDGAAYFRGSTEYISGLYPYYQTCVEANNPSSTSKTMYFRWTDSNGYSASGAMESGKFDKSCVNTGLTEVRIIGSTCGFDPSCR